MGDRGGQRQHGRAPVARGPRPRRRRAAGKRRPSVRSPGGHVDLRHTRGPAPAGRLAARRGDVRRSGAPRGARGATSARCTGSWSRAVFSSSRCPPARRCGATSTRRSGIFGAIAGSRLVGELAAAGFEPLAARYIYASLVPAAAILRALPYRLGRRKSQADVLAGVRQELDVPRAVDRAARLVLSCERDSRGSSPALRPEPGGRRAKARLIGRRTQDSPAGRRTQESSTGRRAHDDASGDGVATGAAAS